jgi:hypothetical protein
MLDTPTIETQSIVTHDGPAEVPVGCTFEIHGLNEFDEIEDIYYQGADWSLACRTFHTMTCDLVQLEGHERVEVGYIDAQGEFQMLSGEDRMEPEEEDLDDEDELDEIDW